MKLEKHNKSLNKMEYRTFDVRKEDINLEDRTARLSFSSETLVQRSYGFELLGHREGEIILNSLLNKAPLLLEHDREKQIGVVEQATIENARGEALVRFSQSPLGQEIFQDVQDGIRTKISVGYVTYDRKQTGEERGIPIFRAVSWEPKEISSVSIPADESVGIGRAEEELQNNGEQRMENLENKQPDTMVVKETLSAERKRTEEIRSIVDQFEKNYPDVKQLGRKYEQDGRSADDFSKAVLQLVASKPVVNPISHEIGLTKKEKRNFSIVRMVNAQIANRSDLAPFEHECSRAVEKQFGVTAKGFYIPMDILHRDLDFTTESTDLVKTNLLTGSFIELLYNKAVTRQLGATYLEGIVGNIDIPRMSGGATAYWASTENGGVTESTQTFDKVSLTPHTLGCVSDVSKLLLNQTSLSAEQMLINDMATTIALAIDTAALNGAGSAGEPAGLLQSSITEDNIGTSTGITYADIVSMESSLATYNADAGNIAFLTTPKVRGKLRQTFSNATYGEIPAWSNNDTMLGYKAMVSNVVPSTISTDHHVLFFGNWSELIVCLFAPGIDVTIDPYTLAKTRLVSLISYMDVDIGIRHLRSFVYANNIKNSGL